MIKLNQSRLHFHPIFFTCTTNFFISNLKTIDKFCQATTTIPKSQNSVSPITCLCFSQLFISSFIPIIQFLLSSLPPFFNFLFFLTVHFVEKSCFILSPFPKKGWSKIDQLFEPQPWYCEEDIYFLKACLDDSISDNILVLGQNIYLSKPQKN